MRIVDPALFTVVKLRAQLDTGADMDLKLSDAGDLDPHAVASVFKSYLRERAFNVPLLTPPRIGADLSIVSQCRLQF